MVVAELAYEMVSDIWEDTLDSFKGGLQKNPATRFISNIYAFGLDGGAFDGEQANEIIYKDYGESLRIYGFRKYKKGKDETPIGNYDDIIFEGGHITGFKNGGELVQRPLRDLYDDDFGLLGAAGKFLSSDGGGEETEMREEMVKSAIRYYSLPSKSRDIGNGFRVAEIPTGSGESWWKDLYQRCDKGLVAYYGAQMISYYVMDWTTKKFRNIISKAPMSGFMRDHLKGKQSLLEERIRRQYIRFVDNVNKLMGIDKEIETVF